MKKFKRVYFHYLQREEFSGGMWRSVPAESREHYATAAADLMRDPERFKAAMVGAITTWPNSCAQALTAEAMNQRAWMGHAGCCLATGSPEDTTRAGWNMLNEQEQILANQAADEAIEIWRDQYSEATTGN